MHVTSLQFIGYFVIGAFIGLIFVLSVLKDADMDDRMITLVLLSVFWAPFVGLLGVAFILWSVIRGGDFAIKIARSILKV